MRKAKYSPPAIILGNTVVQPQLSFNQKGKEFAVTATLR